MFLSFQSCWRISRAIVVTLINTSVHTSFEEAEARESQEKNLYKLEIARNKYMRADVLNMIENYDEKTKEKSYLFQEKNRVLDIKFKDLGMRDRYLHNYERLGITNTRELLAFCDSLGKTRPKSAGRTLYVGGVTELKKLLEDENMSWILEREQAEEED